MIREYNLKATIEGLKEIRGHNTEELTIEGFKEIRGYNLEKSMFPIETFPGVRRTQIRGKHTLGENQEMKYARKYVRDHQKKIEENYPNMDYIAIVHNTGVVDAGNDQEELIRRVAENHPEQKIVIFNFTTLGEQR